MERGFNRLSVEDPDPDANDKEAVVEGGLKRKE